VQAALYTRAVRKPHGHDSALNRDREAAGTAETSTPVSYSQELDNTSVSGAAFLR
jgi:hypothetical protein